MMKLSYFDILRFLVLRFDISHEFSGSTVNSLKPLLFLPLNREPLNHESFPTYSYTFQPSKI